MSKKFYYSFPLLGYSSLLCHKAQIPALQIEMPVYTFMEKVDRNEKIIHQKILKPLTPQKISLIE